MFKKIIQHETQRLASKTLKKRSCLSFSTFSTSYHLSHFCFPSVCTHPLTWGSCSSTTLKDHNHWNPSHIVAQMVKNPPAMQETCVQSLGWEDPLEKGTANYSSILAWRIPWTEEPSRLQSMGLPRVGHNWATFTLHIVDSLPTR